MQVYPGDPGVDLHPALDLDSDGAAVTAVNIGSHSGTHIDAPSHTVAGGRGMEDVRLDELVGDALVLRVEGLGTARPSGSATSPSCRTGCRPSSCSTSAGPGTSAGSGRCGIRRSPRRWPSC
ncbi:cyclase family protein [Herbiconiux sp. SYSU D00978]|uniref:cyclase family protein n=1 Tax=Herbiconiux sp. SYSU D00978 TaxID=2812562 RepID=UPI002418A85B|nr:cyclase family protein [Herbiconiux sp. SYSU D00978]